jgi:folylpolyglutamate synthase
MVTNETQLLKCQKSQTAWLKLHDCAAKITKQQATSAPSGDQGKSNDRDTSSPDRKICRHDNQDIHNGVASDSDHKYSSNNNQPHRDCSCLCTATFGSILEALHWISQGDSLGLPQMAINVESAKILQEADHIQVLCTGSLHLVGGILGLLEPDVCDK